MLNVKSALERDRARELLRMANAAPAASPAPSCSSDSGDSEDGGDNMDSTKSGGDRLRSVTKKLGYLLYVAKKMANKDGTRERASSHKFVGPQTEAQRSFVASILTSVPLMSRCQVLLNAFQQAALQSGRSEPDLLGVVANVVHQVKYGTASICWKKHMVPAQSNFNELRIKYESVKEIHNQTRQEYLKEVAMLRDQVRARGNPDDGLPISFDVMSFFEPGNAILPEERKYFLSAVTEKVKMIFEQNPKVAKTVDFGQIQRLRDGIECLELKELKRALSAQVQETVAAKQGLKDSRNELAETRQICKLAMEGREGGIPNCLFESMEHKLTSLRIELEGAQEAQRSSKQRAEGIAMERDDLTRVLEEETAENALLQRQMASLQPAQERLQATEEELAESKRRVTAQDETLETMKTSVARFKTMFTKQRRRPEDHDEPEVAGSRLVPEESHADVGEEDHRDLWGSKASCGSAVSSARSEEPCSEPEALSKELGEAATGSDALQYAESQLQQARDRCGLLSSRLEQLSAHNQKLESLLRANMESLALRDSEEVLDDAEHFADLAKSLGCGCDGDGGPGLASASPRGRKCANVSTDDSVCCQRCGVKSNDNDHCKGDSAERQAVAASLQLKEIQDKLRSAIVRLKTKGAPCPEQGGDAEWSEDTWRLGKEVAALKHQQTICEARLLVERVKKAALGATIGEHDASTQAAPSDGSACCKSAEELHATKQLNQELLRICNEATDMLQRVANTNYQLSTDNHLSQDLLNSVSVAFNNSGALMALSEDGELVNCLKEVEKAKERSLQPVFAGLSGDGDPRYRARRESRQLKLIQETQHALYIMHFEWPYPPCALSDVLQVRKTSVDSIPNSVSPPKGGHHRTRAPWMPLRIADTCQVDNVPAIPETLVGASSLLQRRSMKQTTGSGMTTLPDLSLAASLLSPLSQRGSLTSFCSQVSAPDTRVKSPEPDKEALFVTGQNSSPRGSSGPCGGGKSMPLRRLSLSANSSGRQLASPVSSAKPPVGDIRLPVLGRGSPKAPRRPTPPGLSPLGREHTSK